MYDIMDSYRLAFLIVGAGRSGGCPCCADGGKAANGGGEGGGRARGVGNAPQVTVRATC